MEALPGPGHPARLMELVGGSEIPVFLLLHLASLQHPSRSVAYRDDLTEALWLIRNHPELKDLQIVRLIGTTKSTITHIRERTH